MQRNFDVPSSSAFPRMPFYNSRRGITLTELLVVIGIVALLAAVLFPVFGRVRENSRKSSCLSNLKQLSGAMLLYCQDYNDKLPHSAQASDPVDGGWVLGAGGAAYTFPTDVAKGALYPYVKNTQVYICPSDTNAKTKALSYSMNMICSQKRLAGASKTSQTIILVDESATLNDGNFNSQLCGGNDKPTVIHSDGASMAYLDGHTKWQNPEQLQKKDYRFNDADCP